MAVLFDPEEFDKLKEVLILYNCALRDVSTRIETLLEDFRFFQPSNPVEHVKSRMKTSESIAEKLHRLGMAVTAENARNKLYDIAGARIICSYARDIFFIADALKKQPDLDVIIEKDYVTHPKPNGYRSYHLILRVPVYMSCATHAVPVEVQIRTQAMDFWASLEHKVRYKFRGTKNIPPEINDNLSACAENIDGLDREMQRIHDLVERIPLNGQG